MNTSLLCLCEFWVQSAMLVYALGYAPVLLCWFSLKCWVYFLLMENNLLNLCVVQSGLLLGICAHEIWVQLFVVMFSLPCGNTRREWS